MPNPVYVTSVNVLFDGTMTDVVVLVDGSPAYLMRWDQMDDHVKADVAYLVAQCGPLPYPNLTNLVNTWLPANGNTFFDTYAKSIHVVGSKPTMAPSPVNQELVYWDGAAWLKLSDDTPA